MTINDNGLISDRRFWRAVGWGSIVALLLLPAVAMQFTDEVQWTASDFMFAGIMLGGVGIAFEMAFRRSSSTSYRAAIATVLLGVLMLVWVNGAVGIIGSEQNDANMMYGAMLLLGSIGAAASGLRAREMSAVMLGMAIAQVVICAIALLLQMGTDGSIWPRDVIGATGVFATIWLVSAALFRRAAVQ